MLSHIFVKCWVKAVVFKRRTRQNYVFLQELWTRLCLAVNYSCFMPQELKKIDKIHYNWSSWKVQRSSIRFDFSPWKFILLKPHWSMCLNKRPSAYFLRNWLVPLRRLMSISFGKLVMLARPCMPLQSRRIRIWFNLLSLLQLVTSQVI